MNEWIFLYLTTFSVFYGRLNRNVQFLIHSNMFEVLNIKLSIHLTIIITTLQHYYFTMWFI